MHPPRLVVI
jgi:hypothetical protein